MCVACASMLICVNMKYQSFHICSSAVCTICVAEKAQNKTKFITYFSTNCIQTEMEFIFGFGFFLSELNEIRFIPVQSNDHIGVVVVRMH